MQGTSYKLCGKACSVKKLPLTRNLRMFIRIIKQRIMKTKIQIKTVFEKIIFEHESENNTIIETVNEYIIQELEKGLRSANLRSANLSSADLRNADLSSADLRNADLRYADLRSANLSSADLRSANLSFADLRSADLRFANLRSADLSYADLRYANLRSANLSSADLSNADLSYADLRYVNLRSADLSSANLSYADLRNADLSYLKHNECTVFLLPQCPSEGSFISWKKAGGKIVKLLVTDDAKRSSSTTLKCRCSKAKVLGIENLDGTDSGLTEIKSNHDDNFIYRVGEIVEVDNFDENRFNECSTGIHFFIARESAVAY
jgi:uncharacterized protein YjbI with pentapeptide repeats